MKKKITFKNPEDFIIKVKNSKRVFESSIATRYLDTESIGFEYFDKQKNAVKDNKYPNVTGEMQVTSDFCPCSLLNITKMEYKYYINSYNGIETLYRTRWRGYVRIDSGEIFSVPTTVSRKGGKIYLSD
jgi:hypothetical protein